MVPKVLTAKARYDLRRGAIFRFSGTVSPRLRGESVELLTDRGGSWRPISLQTAVKLSEGRTWTSRRFGTPRAETYRLRAHLKATKAARGGVEPHRDRVHPLTGRRARAGRRPAVRQRHPG